MPLNINTALGLGLGAAGAVGQAMGIGQKRQVKQQAKLNAEQVKSQKELADYQQKLQMDMWNQTNYGAQVKHLKEAGLNPALLYGKGGGGGTTIGGGMSTGVSGGSAEAPSATNKAFEGMSMIPAQIEMMKAQTENIKADTANKQGVEPALKEAQTASLIQGIENAKQQQMLTQVQERLAKLDEALKGQSMNNLLHRLEYETKKAGSEMEIALNEAYISNETKESKIKIFTEEAIGAGLKNILTQAQTEKEYSGIDVNEAQIKKMAADIAQAWEGLEQGDTRNAIEKFKAEMAANNPSIMNVAGRQLDDWISTLWNIVGGKRPQYKNIE